jgi:hypothetical protein
MMPVFETRSGVPYSDVNLKTGMVYSDVWFLIYILFNFIDTPKQS